MSNCWQAWKGDAAFSMEMINAIRDQMDHLDKDNGIIRSSSGTGLYKEIRRSKVKFIYDDYIKNTLYNFVLQANRMSFAYDITQCCDIQYTEYHATEKGHYDWHKD